jgi:hypothetical protein
LFIANDQFRLHGEAWPPRTEAASGRMPSPEGASSGTHDAML